ncbi:MAG TPA: DUF3105 domain-containing protein [Anaerolineales bacterium]|nr:DUF3105 domain-containing protein [Anaerolineales bacterium]
MDSKSARERMRGQRRRLRTRSLLIWGGVAAGLIVLVAALLRPRVQPSVGEAVPVMESSAHVETGTDPGPYNSDPPTSGRHYGESLPSGFYEESEAADFGAYPEGRLVHSLEHGYVILWYDCERLSESDCTQLKGQIRQVMDNAGNLKVIAFPWSSVDVPVVMTSWGQMLRMENFDLASANEFIRTNRNRAPEPQAP